MSLSLSRLHVGKDLLFREKYGVLEPDFMSQMELRFLFISVHSVKLSTPEPLLLSNQTGYVEERNELFKARKCQNVSKKDEK